MEAQVNNNDDINKDEIIKRYKREINNLHKALSRIQKDKEQLLAENLRLKEIVNNKT